MMRGATMMMAAAALALTGTTALADPGKGNGNGNGKGNGKAGHARHHAPAPGHAGYGRGCPPGLAKKDPACVPPGQARNDDDRRYGNRVGDVLRIGDYRVIRDVDRYDLDRRDGWDYYRDDDRVYRVDRDTRKVLAVLNLIDAFAN